MNEFWVMDEHFERFAKIDGAREEALARSLRWRPLQDTSASELAASGRVPELTCAQMSGATVAASGRHWARVAEFPGARRALAMARYLLVKMSKVPDADLYGGCRAQFYAGQRRRPGPPAPLSEKLRQLFRGPLWLKLTRLYFVYSSLKLIVRILARHVYNVHHAAVQRLEASLEATGNQADQPEAAASIERQLELERALLESASGRLAALGAPLLNNNFIIVAAGVVQLVGTYCTFMHAHLFLHFDYGVVRALLDGALEQQHQINGAICDQVNRFVKSAESHLKTRLGQMALTLSTRPSGLDFKSRPLGVLPDDVGALNRPTRASVVRARLAPEGRKHARQLYELERARLIERHASLGGQLRQLALAGRLQPPNRNGVWLSKLALLYLTILGGGMFITNTVPMIGAAMLAAGGGSSKEDAAAHSRQRAHLMVTLELAPHYELNVLSTFFYLPIMTVACADQIKHALALLSALDAAIRAHDRWLTSEQLESRRYKSVRSSRELGTTNSRAPSSQARDELRLQLELKLVVALVRFRLFVEQMRAIKRSTGMLLSVCVLLVCLIPILSRVFAQFMDTQCKLVVLMGAIQVFLPVELFILPNCYLHNRCLDLHKRLWSLLARSIEVARAQAVNLDSQIHHDSHTIRLLRQELSFTEQSLDKFLPRALYQEVTYASLLRMQFWCGLLLISMFFADSSKGQTGGLLDETLHLL